MDLHSGDVFDADIAYDGTNVVLTLTDTVTNKSGTFSWAADIPSLVGGNTAYVGFTAGTGGLQRQSRHSHLEFHVYLVQPPAAPTNALTSLITSNEVDFTWTDNANNETGYEVWRSISGGNFTLAATLPANTTSYQDTGLTPNTDIDYHIDAFNWRAPPTLPISRYDRRHSPAGPGASKP